MPEKESLPSRITVFRIITLHTFSYTEALQFKFYIIWCLGGAPPEFSMA